MKNLLVFLVRSIVENPARVAVESEEKDGFLSLKLEAHPDDIKIIIGKEGRTIKAIRQLMKVKAGQSGKKFNFTLVENETKT